VLVLEQNAVVGGKMGQAAEAGYRWDTGPSLITMRPVFEDLFRAAGRRLEDYLTLEPVDPLTRCFFADGSQLDASRDLSRMAAQLRAFDERDVEGYLAFLAYAARLYRIVSPVFIYSQPPGLHSLGRVKLLDALRFDGLRPMSRAIESFVHSPQLRQWLGIFATYVGASPYRAPATLNVIAHVELNEGVWYPRGGVYQIASAYERLAIELGVEIRTRARVQAIEARHGRVCGVTLADGERLPAAAVVANLDVASVYARLLAADSESRPAARFTQDELSCSAYVMLLGVRGERPNWPITIPSSRPITGASSTKFSRSSYRPSNRPSMPPSPRNPRPRMRRPVVKTGSSRSTCQRSARVGIGGLTRPLMATRCWRCWPGAASICARRSSTAAISRPWTGKP
jgi:phytoene desaturase